MVIYPLAHTPESPRKMDHKGKNNPSRPKAPGRIPPDRLWTRDSCTGVEDDGGADATCWPGHRLLAKSGLFANSSPKNNPTTTRVDHNQTWIDSTRVFQKTLLQQMIRNMLTSLSVLFELLGRKSWTVIDNWAPSEKCTTSHSRGLCAARLPATVGVHVCPEFAQR